MSGVCQGVCIQSTALVLLRCCGAEMCVCGSRRLQVVLLLSYMQDGYKLAKLRLLPVPSEAVQTCGLQVVQPKCPVALTCF